MTPLYRILESHLGSRLAGPVLAVIYAFLLASILLLANLDGLVPIIYLDMP
ncbi:MAG: hypothetical protein OEN23_18465 [Paracoccaceae bacterium]|nr:hypothetical protein [Paracoccaceae bacterium]